MKTRRLAIGLLASAVILGTGYVPQTLAQSQNQTQNQTASELLQKGIYLQETVGDLDGAIKIYQQIAQMANESRASAAQAEYRLGLCLQKKSRQAEADKTFQDLIAKYPEQTDVVSKARAFVSSAAELKFLPAPWKDGEVLELFLKSSNGRLGTVMRYSIASSKTNPRHWLFGNNVSNLSMQSQTQVEVDNETMKPISTSWTHPAVGDLQITYQASQARIEQKGKDPKIVPLGGTAWDNEEVLALLRRLPLAPGFKTTLPILSPTGLLIKVEFVVTGAEDVKTPAGTFHCYRVAADAIRQALFISADDARYPVKLEMPVGSAELERVSDGRATGPVVYKDDRSGVSLTAPEGWRVYNYDLEGSEDAVANLIDPDSLVVSTLYVHTLEADYPATQEGMRERMQKDLDKAKTRTVRPDSWQNRQIGGRLAVSCLIDSTDEFRRKITEYSVTVRGDKTLARFTSKLDPGADIEGFQKRFDPILATLTIK